MKYVQPSLFIFSFLRAFLLAGRAGLYVETGNLMVIRPSDSVSTKPARRMTRRKNMKKAGRVLTIFGFNINSSNGPSECTHRSQNAFSRSSDVLSHNLHIFYLQSFTCRFRKCHVHITPGLQNSLPYLCS